MNPSLMEGDVVAWTPTEIKDIQKGDVIVFKSYVHWPDEKIVVHRVSDILTNKKGDTLLETKGDANSWVDQAGPHIPEPYIREDHVLGKVISIGQQPLKIPFIGVTGVWINTGLDLISQPTASQESINYLGVFAPLTISAVIFVMLIFILPEKAKTLKEKLKFNIFGHKPLNLKKTIVSFLVAYIVFLSVIHVSAYDSVSASVGINERSEDAALDFGRIQPGKESFKKDFPLINPSIISVKGFVYANGDIGEYITKKTFTMDKGDIKYLPMQAVASNTSPNGSYIGDVMVYSSPFWIMFPDTVIEYLYNWDGRGAVFALDILSALVLTSITLLMLISITFIGDITSQFYIDRSWRHPSRIIVKKRIRQKLKNIKNQVKKAFENSMFWIIKIKISEKGTGEKNINIWGKPIIASLSVVPIIFLLSDQILAMIISAILSGIIAYFISCKIRSKIILATFITASIAIAYMIIHSNMIIIGKEATIMEILTLSIGALGLYTLILALLLIPLSAISWAITRRFRNVKEQKDPLLCLEGTCDL